MLHGFCRFLKPLALAFAVFAMMGGAVQAQSLDALRASGAVGESSDGLLMARDSSAQSYVDKVNAQRRKIYGQRAAAQGVSAGQVGRVFALNMNTREALAISNRAIGQMWMFGR